MESFRGKNAGKAIAAVASGMLTDLLYDLLAEESFEAFVVGGAVRIIKIDKYSQLQRAGIIIFLFLALWALFSYGFPLAAHIFKSLQYKDMPKIHARGVMETYRACRDSIIPLQEAARETTDINAYILLFGAVCRLVERLHKVFCSKKKGSAVVVRACFRTGATTQDKATRISAYEYLATVELLEGITSSLYRNICLVKSDALMEIDYKKIVEFLKDLKAVPSFCCQGRSG